MNIEFFINKNIPHKTVPKMKKLVANGSCDFIEKELDSAVIAAVPIMMIKPDVELATPATFGKSEMHIPI